MIRGVLTNHLEAWIELAVVSTDQAAVGFSGLIDTGFNGCLTLPRSAIERFGGVQVGRAEVSLADGSKTASRVFEMTILWEGQPIEIEVEDSESESLIGMALLAGHDLQMRVVPDGEVMIREIQSSRETQLLEIVLDGLDRLFDRESSVTDIWALLNATCETLQTTQHRKILESATASLLGVLRSGGSVETQRDRALNATDELRRYFAEKLPIE